MLAASLSFQQPAMLWLLALPVVFLTAYIALQLRRRQYAARFTNLALLDKIVPKRPRWRRHLPTVIILLGLACLACAVAQPFYPVSHGVNRTTVMLAIDISGSMNATDVSPTRIDAAKTAADNFIDSAPDNVNIGIVSFSSTTDLLAPPTQDRASLHQALDTLNAYGATAIGEAIFTSLDAIKQLPPAPDGSPAPARIVLMSDGSTNMGRPNADAEKAAAAQGVQVWTIAFGTPGATLTLPDGTVVDVSVDKAALGEIASATGGRSYSAESAQQINDIYQGIGQSLGYKTEKIDVSAYAAGIAFFLLVLGAGASLFWSSRLL